MYYSNNLIDRSDSKAVNKKVHETRCHNLGKPAFPILLKDYFIQVYSFATFGLRKNVLISAGKLCPFSQCAITMKTCICQTAEEHMLDHFLRVT